MKKVDLYLTSGGKRLHLEARLYRHANSMSRAARKLTRHLKHSPEVLNFKFMAVAAMVPPDKIVLFFNRKDLNLKTIVHEVEHVSQFAFPEHHCLLGRRKRWDKKCQNSSELLAEFVSTVVDELVQLLEVQHA